MRTLTAPKAAGLNRVVLGSARRADAGGAAADEPALRARGPGRPGRHAARRRAAGCRFCSRRERYTVRLNVGGKQLTQQARGPEGSELRRHRRRHHRADQDAHRTAPRRSTRPRTWSTRSNWCAARSPASVRSFDESEIMQPALELERKLDRGRAQPRRASHDRPRPGRRALRLAAARARSTISPADWPAPTSDQPNQQLEVQKVLEEQLRRQQAALDGIVGKELKTLNEFMRGRGVPNIIIRRPGT